jgi:hypothetical protein
MELARHTSGRAEIRSIVWILLGLWFLAVLLLEAKGAFVRTPDTPPLRILLAATIPVALFVAAYVTSQPFQQFILSADTRLFTAIQAWRAGGLAFLALYANGILPALFAWPAGAGDIAIGVTAPWVVMSLVRDPASVGNRRFVLWNLFGILDLVVAVGTGALSSGFIPGLAGEVTTGAMSKLPLLLIPAFIVPLFVMLHLAALFQARHARN